jgi:hypothetical protein
MAATGQYEDASEATATIRQWHFCYVGKDRLGWAGLKASVECVDSSIDTRTDFLQWLHFLLQELHCD